jgi:hypothetical protein
VDPCHHERSVHLVQIRPKRPKEKQTWWVLHGECELMWNERKPFFKTHKRKHKHTHQFEFPMIPLGQCLGSSMLLRGIWINPVAVYYIHSQRQEKEDDEDYVYSAVTHSFPKLIPCLNQIYSLASLSSGPGDRGYQTEAPVYVYRRAW